MTANVSSNCIVSTTPVAFGSVSPGTSKDAAGGLTITCTNGTDWTAKSDIGGGANATFDARTMIGGAFGEEMVYSLYKDAARTTVWGDGTSSTETISGTGTGTAQNVAIYGRVASGQTALTVGSYSDTVDVTITY
ncbi:MAG TPA: spore coat U domain-containing protein [Allosphingosinicella sp.]|uniref:Csu type fimbrial protein n=1 Tax=Allosphingosinicella sp. TaxID=2823234 RepID=UPI002EDB4990